LPVALGKIFPVGGRKKGSVNQSEPNFDHKGEGSAGVDSSPFTVRQIAVWGSGMASKPKEAAKQTEAEANDGEENAEGAAPPKRKLPLKLILIAVGGLVAVGGIGTGAYMMFFGHKEPKVAANAVKPAVFVDLPEVLVNLSNTSGERTQYLKIKIVLELADQALMQQIQPVMPRLTDTFQTYLRELRPTDLDGSAGLYRLKEELTRRVNALIAPNKVNAVLFKEIVVQ
jgi:flagellar protein FliL